MLAAERGHAECARVLLESGADVQVHEEVRDIAPRPILLPKSSLSLRKSIYLNGCNDRTLKNIAAYILFLRVPFSAIQFSGFGIGRRLETKCFLGRVI